MPSRAFIDSDQQDYSPDICLCGVLMPSRAFIDSDYFHRVVGKLVTLDVLMPSRAFIDSDLSLLAILIRSTTDTS